MKISAKEAPTSPEQDHWRWIGYGGIEDNVFVEITVEGKSVIIGIPKTVLRDANPDHYGLNIVTRGHYV